MAYRETEDKEVVLLSNASNLTKPTKIFGEEPLEPENEAVLIQEIADDLGDNFLDKIGEEEPEKEMGNGIPFYQNNPLFLYYKDLARFPLLDRQKEIKLAKRVEKGDEQARKELILGNLRLVISVAKKIAFYRGNQHLKFLDLIQEGNLGLFKAVERFNWRLGFKFSTYATWWIKQAIFRAIENTSRDIRLPVHISIDANQLSRAERKLLNGEEIDDEKLAEFLGWTIKKVKRVKEATKITSPLSLHRHIKDRHNNSSEEELIDFIAGQTEKESEELVFGNEQREKIAAVLKTLRKEEKFVLERRFGFVGGGEMTLEQIGELLGITRERVRQIEERALRKLRHPKRTKVLKPFYNETKNT